MHYRLICLALAASVPTVSQAAEPAQMTAASCVPVSGPYKVTATKVTFKTGKTGKIVLHCVTRTEDLVAADTGGLFLVVTYRDSGGPAATGQVKATLVGIAKDTGQSDFALQFDSNAETPSPSVTSNVGSKIPAIVPGVHIHMRIELKRANTGQSVEFHGAGYEF